VGKFTKEDVSRQVRVRLPRLVERDGNLSGDPIWVRGFLYAPADGEGRVSVNVCDRSMRLCPMKVTEDCVELWDEPIEDGTTERPYKLWL